MKPLFFSRGKSEAGAGAQEAACILSTWVRLEEAQRLDHKVPVQAAPLELQRSLGLKEAGVKCYGLAIRRSPRMGVSRFKTNTEWE